MDVYLRPIRPDELYHHGIKGQKWGLRRFQNADGTLTSAGRQRYNVDSKPNVVARALFNGEIGQRMAVRANSGYRQDKKAIKADYKEKMAGKDRATKKELKADRKAEINEAKVATADALYGRQSHAANTAIQTESSKKAIAKSLLMGGYGAKTYNEVRHQDGKTNSRGAAAVLGIIADYGNNYTLGALSIVDYAGSKTRSPKAEARYKGSEARYEKLAAEAKKSRASAAKRG